MNTPNPHWTLIYPERPCYIPRLFRAIKALGFRLGYRYWTIENDCIANPSVATYWAERCELEAQILQRNGDYEMAYAMVAWAKDLRSSYEYYMQQME